MDNPFRTKYLRHLSRITNEYPKALIIGKRARNIISNIAKHEHRTLEPKEVAYPFWYLKKFIKDFTP